MNTKIVNRFINIFKKIHKRKILSVFPVLSFLLLMQFHEGFTADYAPDISNPFLDVFYCYFNNDPGRAKKILKKEFDSASRGTQAYINYGLIMQYEKKYEEAESYYRKALEMNDRSSIVYLYDLYNHYDRSKAACLLDAVGKNIDSCWTDYEKAVCHIEQGDRQQAVDCLMSAVKKGLPSPLLLSADPAFTGLKNDRKFIYILHKAKTNYSDSNSLRSILKDSVFRYRLDKPYGMNMELDAAAYFDKTGRYDKAVDILESMLNKQTGFRDRSIALFWMARIKSRLHENSAAVKYLKEFIAHMHGSEIDDTGYKKLVAPVYKDIIMNDRYLKDIPLAP